MTESERGKIVDYHQFEIWRYENDSVDVYSNREDAPLDVHTAYLEAMVISRTMAENLQDAEEVCTIKVFENGASSTFFRDYNEEVNTWRRFRWVRERLHAASYAGIIGMPKLPNWLMTVLWVLEFFVARNYLQWGILRGQWTAQSIVEAGSQVVPSSYVSDLNTTRTPAGTATIIPFPRKDR